MTLGRRVAVMRDGVLEQVAPPLELFRRPANTFVAGFIGAPAMNLLQGMMSPGSGGRRLTTPAFTLDATGGADSALAAGASSADRAVTIGIRPDDIELTAPGAAHGSGIIEVVEPLGATTMVHLRIDRLADPLLRVAVRADTPPAIGARAGFRLDVSRLHLFDGQTGRRLDQPADT